MPAEASLVSPHGRSLSAYPGLYTVDLARALKPGLTGRRGIGGEVAAIDQTGVERAARRAARTSVA
jgi:hypothetical protein